MREARGNHYFAYMPVEQERKTSFKTNRYREKQRVKKNKTTTNVHHLPSLPVVSCSSQRLFFFFSAPSSSSSFFSSSLSSSSRRGQEKGEWSRGRKNSSTKHSRPASRGRYGGLLPSPRSFPSTPVSTPRQQLALRVGKKRKLWFVFGK